MRFFLALAAFSLLCVAQCATAQQTGSITGTVVDVSGNPVAGARVHAAPVGGWIMPGLVQYAMTDRHGRFSIGNLRLGRYGVFAMKQDALYPDVSSSFYSNNVFPTAVITSLEPVAKIQIRLGPQAGTLTGSVTDAQTGKPLLAGLDLSRTSSPNKWLSTSIPTQYRVLVPSSTDVSVAFEAPGYRKWVLTAPIDLKPGEELHLDVALEPAFNPNLRISQFLVPDGYVGWVLLTYNQKNAPPAAISEDAIIFKFPQSGHLKISSAGPNPNSKKIYLYYAPNGSTHDVPMDYRNDEGMIWGDYQATLDGVVSEYGFFVGTRDQYGKAKTRRPLR